MAKTRSQEDDPVPQWLLRFEEATEQWCSRFQEATDQRVSRLEAKVADLLCRSRKGKKENPEDQICNDEELTEIEAEIKSSGIEDRAVENEANATMISTIDKEEPIPQLQVPVSKLELSLRFCNASPDVCEDFKPLVGLDGLFDHVKARNELVTKSTSVTNQVAYQLFDVIPMRTKVLPKEHKKRFHKSWRFKFKDKVQPRGLIQEQLGVHEGNATRNQLRSPSGFVVDDLHSGFGSDIWCVQFLVGSVVVEDFQETQWLFNDELKDNQIFQILIEEGSNSSAYQKFNGMRIGSHRLHHQKKLKPRHAIGERDEMLEVARDVSKRSMLGLTFGIRESNAGEDQRAVCEQIIKVNVWLYQISLVLQQVMRSKKFKFLKRWMFKYKVDEEDQGSLQSRAGHSLSRREILTFTSQAKALLFESKDWIEKQIPTLKFLKQINISQYRWIQEVIVVIGFLLRRHLHLNLDCEEPKLAGQKRNHGLFIRLHSKQKQRKCPKSWMFKFKTGSKLAGTSHLKRHKESGLCAQIRGVRKKSKLLLLSLCPSFLCRAMLRFFLLYQTLRSRFLQRREI